jgi:hypothetical protein
MQKMSLTLLFRAYEREDPGGDVLFRAKNVFISSMAVLTANDKNL